MAASCPISTQVGAIAVRRISAPSSNSRARASHLPRRKRICSVCGSCIGNDPLLRPRNSGMMRIAACNAARAIISPAIPSTPETRYPVHSLNNASNDELPSRRHGFLLNTLALTSSFLGHATCACKNVVAQFIVMCLL